MTSVMVVDDCMAMRELLKEILQRDGYKVVAEASSGEQAIEEYLRCAPQLVTMDIELPGVNGLEATKQITSSDASATVLLLTALGNSLVERAAYNAGAKGYLEKPFEVLQLLSEIERVLMRSSTRLADGVVAKRV